MTMNNFCTLNTPGSYTRVSSRGKKSSPDITVVPVQWSGRIRWSSLVKRQGGSDHIPILIDVNLPGRIPTKEKKRSNRKRQRPAKWAFSKANWTLFRDQLDKQIELWPQKSST